MYFCPASIAEAIGANQDITAYHIKEKKHKKYVAMPAQDWTMVRSCPVNVGGVRS
jgi:hypothetical protein